MAEIGLKVLSLAGNVLAGAIGIVQSVTGTKPPKDPADHQWQKPSPTDRKDTTTSLSSNYTPPKMLKLNVCPVRSPCPMVNALANHGYLPRSGRSVSLARLITGCREGINLSPEATLIVGLKALQASSTWFPPFTFNLDDLNKHGVIEHDGSLSRKDTAQGDNHTFAPEVWAIVAAHFGTDQQTISIETAAAARKDRLDRAPAMNPDFKMSPDDVRFSLIETALYLGVFGRGTEGFARTEWVRTLFGEY